MCVRVFSELVTRNGKLNYYLYMRFRRAKCSELEAELLVIYITNFRPQITNIFVRTVRCRPTQGFVRREMFDHIPGMTE